MFGRTKKDDTAVRLRADTTTEQPRATSGPLTPEHVVWAYRLLLDREPESDAVIGPKLAGSRDTSELRHHLMTSAEFQQKNRDYAHTNDRTIVIKELDGVGDYLVIEPRAVTMEVYGQPARVIDLEALITAKSRAGRVKDKMGVLHLESLRKLKDSRG